MLAASPTGQRQAKTLTLEQHKDMKGLRKEIPGITTTLGHKVEVVT